MAEIPITGVPSTFRVPGQFAEILFAQGPATASAAAREVIFVMAKTAAGTWLPNTVYRVRNEQEVRQGGGVGSPIHRGIRKFLLANKRAKIWALPYNATSGGLPVAADLDVTWVGTPTGSGTTSVRVAGEDNFVGFTTNDTPTSIATNMRDVINAKEHLPCVATSSGGTLTLTARIAGESQGDGTTGTIRVHTDISAGVTTTVATENALQDDFLSGGAGANGVDGSTTEVTNLTTALATITGARYYYMVFNVWNATGLQAIQTHISSKSEPIPGLRSAGIVGYTGTVASVQALATARNFERLNIAWQSRSEHDPAELAGNYAAILQKREQTDAAFNFDGYRGSDWLIQAAFRQSDWPDLDDQNDAIVDGVTPIASDHNGSYVVMAITTRSKNASGAVDDFRAAERHRISVADEYGDTLLLRHAVAYGGKKLKDDERFANGEVNPSQRVRPGVVTPSQYAPFVKRLLTEFDDRSLLQQIAASKESLRTVIDPNNTGRLEVGHDLHVIDLLHQTTFRLAEVSPG